MDDMVSNTVWISHLIFCSFAAMRVIVTSSRAPNSSLNVNDIFHGTPPENEHMVSLENHPPVEKVQIIWTKTSWWPGGFQPLVSLLVLCLYIHPLKMNGWFTEKKNCPLNQKVPIIWTIHLHDFGVPNLHSFCALRVLRLRPCISRRRRPHGKHRKDCFLDCRIVKKIWESLRFCRFLSYDHSWNVNCKLICIRWIKMTTRSLVTV